MSIRTLFSPQPAGAEPDAFAAFAADEVTAQTIARVAEARGWPADSVQSGGIEAATRTLAVLPSAHLLVLDISDTPDPLADLAALDDLIDPHSRIIVLGTLNDIGLYRRLAAVGVADYLVKPLSAENLSTALDAALITTAPAPTETRKGRVAAVIGARGGVGASTVAANLAWLFGHSFGQRTALVDLDLQFGIAPLLFDLEASQGLRELLEQPDRLDELFLERAMVRESEHLFVLGAEEALDDPPCYDSQGLRSLLDELAARFDRVVIDLPRHAAAAHLAALEPAGEIVVVTELTLTGLRDSNRLIRFARANVPDARIVVTANRALGRGRAAVARREFAKALEAPLEHEIPFDEKAAAKSQNVGRPFPRVGHARRTVKALTRLARALHEPVSAKPGRKDRKDES